MKEKAQEYAEAVIAHRRAEDAVRMAQSHRDACARAVKTIESNLSDYVGRNIPELYIGVRDCRAVAIQWRDKDEGGTLVRLVEVI